MAVKNHYIVVAAGSGSRYGGNLPKQFCDLNGRPLLMTTLERLNACRPDWNIIVVLSKDMICEWEKMCLDHDFTLQHHIVAGGATRAMSVKNALDTLPQDVDGYIGVHDAARPVVTKAMIDSLTEGLADGADGTIPSCPVTDSIRRINEDGSSVAVDRSYFRSVPTPQIFPAGKLLDANRRMMKDESVDSKKFTDDASVMEAAGYTDLRLTKGDPHNIKVTNPGDMAIAELYLQTITD